MRKKVCAVLGFMLLLMPVSIYAQQVLYAYYSRGSSDAQYDVIGKVGNFYWVQKNKKTNSTINLKYKKKRSKEPGFEIFTNKMNWFRSINYDLPDSVSKEYLVSGDYYLDQLILLKTESGTNFCLNRYTPDGELVRVQDTIAFFPANLTAEDVLLVRSQDGSKLLLLGFEHIEGAQKVHVFTYDSDWNVLFQGVYQDINITQPFVQYEFTNYPLEDFENAPVKLYNNGAWLMLAPSRRSTHYLLFQFQSKDSSFKYKNVELPKHRGVQELSLSLDNEKREAFAGILLNSSIPEIKKVRIVHYLFDQHQFAFDTTYQFSTLAASPKRNEKIFTEYFLPVPGKGFMLLKEYGRPFYTNYMNEELRAEDSLEIESAPTLSDLPLYYNKKDYTFYDHLSVRKAEFERGDLSLYFLPAIKGDSCWSGLLNQEQNSELNSANLSYVFVPKGGKLVFLYNSINRKNNLFSNTTILDKEGHPINEGIMFWKGGNNLNFQKAKLISVEELSVPFGINGREGFALIRM